MARFFRISQYPIDTGSHPLWVGWSTASSGYPKLSDLVYKYFKGKRFIEAATFEEDGRTFRGVYTDGVGWKFALRLEYIELVPHPTANYHQQTAHIIWEPDLGAIQQEYNARG